MQRDKFKLWKKIKRHSRPSVSFYLFDDAVSSGSVKSYQVHDNGKQHLPQPQYIVAAKAIYMRISRSLTLSLNVYILLLSEVEVLCSCV